MKFLLLVIALFGLSSQVMAGNPGQDAMDCISTSDGEVDSNNGQKVIVTNNCQGKVFVLYCGDLRYDNRTCGSDDNGAFYTHSINIAPNGSDDIVITAGGSYNFAACFGSISFGNDGEYTDSANGSYRCLPTGEYASSDEEE